MKSIISNISEIEILGKGRKFVPKEHFSNNNGKSFAQVVSGPNISRLDEGFLHHFGDKVEYIPEGPKKIRYGDIQLRFGPTELQQVTSQEILEAVTSIDGKPVDVWTIHHLMCHNVNGALKGDYDFTDGVCTTANLFHVNGETRWICISWSTLSWVLQMETRGQTWTWNLNNYTPLYNKVNIRVVFL